MDPTPSTYLLLPNEGWLEYSLLDSSANTLITYYLDPIFTWTAFDASQGIPYLNFNDCELPWLASFRACAHIP